MLLCACASAEPRCDCRFGVETPGHMPGTLQPLQASQDHSTSLCTVLMLRRRCLSVEAGSELCVDLTLQDATWAQRLRRMLGQTLMDR